MEKKLPNFFIVGAPKAGTTSLYQYLRNHPEVLMSPIKEPNFFAYDETIRQNLYHKEKGVGTFAEYIDLFKSANGHHKAVGEASVSYLFYPTVPARIKEFVPDAKIIMVLRNPVDRAYSHYFMEHKLGYVREPLSKIVFRTSTHKYADLYYQQYIELGLYYRQVKRYLDTFGEDQVRIFIYDDLNTGLQKIIRSVFDFLTIDPAYLSELEGKYNTYSTPRNALFRTLYAQKGLRLLARKIVPDTAVEKVKKLFLTRKKKSDVEESVAKEMKRIFTPDIKELEKLLNRNLSSWYE